jgi:hypothetical protein
MSLTDHRLGWVLIISSFIITWASILVALVYGIHSSTFITVKGIAAAPSVALAAVPVYFAARSNAHQLRTKKLFRFFGIFTFVSMIIYLL